MNNDEKIAFEIISKAGDARSKVFEALDALKDNDCELYEKLISEADATLTEAHKLQFKILSSSANKEPLNVSYLTVHAQDHLMTTMSIKDMAQKLIEIMYSKK